MKNDFSDQQTYYQFFNCSTISDYQLTPEQKTKFAPICPDFVIELRSPSASLEILQEKWVEY